MKIKTLTQLKKLATGENEFYISLAGGLARSSKVIFFDKDKNEWEIDNQIDDTRQNLSTDQLKTETLVLEAMKKGCLFMY